jgi:hypothetical protein
VANYTDIAALSDEVLASVRESSTKTASSAENTSLNSDIGQSLKLAAAAIRNLRDDQVTDADIAAVISQARKYASGVAAEPVLPLAVKSASQEAKSPLSANLRKIAADVRAHGAAADAERAVKTAKMIAAAVGIEHLAKTLKA